MAKLRDLVRERAEDRCEYCRMPQSGTILPHEWDHIRALKHRGSTTKDNLCWSCSQCNGAKGPNIAGFDETTGKLAALYNPRSDFWDDHFFWNEAEMVGKTDIGRTTIEVLNINLSERVSHRELLIAMGDYF